MRKLVRLVCAAAVLIGFVAFDLVARSRGERDFTALERGEKPIFATNPAYLADGGSVEYSGLGYTILRMHRKSPGPGPGNWHRVGPRLEYWIPLPFITPNRDATIITTNR